MNLGLKALLALMIPLSAQAGERLCDGYAGLPDGSAPTAGMSWIPGGSFFMGEDDERPEERPAHRVTVDGFWIDRHEVTNAQFARFVEATGYRTLAERGFSAQERPDLPPELRAPGASVFSIPEGPLVMANVGSWWHYVPGADWRHPIGPNSSIADKANHPVVNVAFEDASAYAAWLGRELPTEAQWERAARGGLEGATYSWGNEYYDPAEGWKANTWQGVFPMKDDADDGHHGTAPVGCFAANGYGLFDMVGNAWEYSKDWYLPGHLVEPTINPPGPPEALAVRFSGSAGPPVVIKGGSWLCAPNFCARYRPSSREPQELGLGASHLGFRTILRAPGPAG
jgi:formylglycine-generating enzyme required for sulfatase activity